MTEHFYVKEERFQELKQFIRDNLPSVRFIQNPQLDYGKYTIYIDLEVEDSNKLNQLHNMWYDLDNPVIIKKTFLNKLKNLLSW